MNLKPNPGFFGAKRSDTGDQLALVQEWDKTRHRNCDQIDRRIREMEEEFANLVKRSNAIDAEYAISGFLARWSLRREADQINERIQENRFLRIRLYDERLARL